MKKIISAVLAATLCIALFAGCNQAEKKKLIMATEAGFAPYEYVIGDKVVGIDVDIAEAIAKEMGMEYFTTTMSVSPHKNYDKIKALGMALQEETGVKFLDIDFKKKNGFGRSVELSKKYGLYRQNFCGCDFARYAAK